MNFGKDISAHLLANAEERVRGIVRALNECHPDDSGRRNRLQEQLREAEQVLRFSREMIEQEA